ncbi:MAG: VWA domain-containing protein [Halioglobus sp.]
MTRAPLVVLQHCPASVIPILLVIYLCCMPAASAADALENPRLPDVRLLIDVSSKSVLHDEPLLLRQWLEGYLHLLPVGARVGVWRYAGTVDEAMPYSTAETRVWLDRPLVNTEERSDLAAALSAASADPAPENSEFKTTIVVVTDSGINVSASPISNAHAARDLVTERVPALVDAGITVHTVAVGDKSDTFLLRALAHGTNGLDFEAKSLADLPSVILQLLDTTSPASAVVVREQGFTLTERDRELRMLLTHLPGATVSLVDSAETDWARDNVPPGTTWLAGSTLDVVTLPTPTPGRWEWGDVAQNYSLIRVSEGVDILADRLPLVLPAGSQQRWHLALPTEGGALIQNGFALIVEVTDPQGGVQVIPLAAAGSGVAGERYTAELPKFDLPGRYRVQATAEHLDISRQITTWVEVLPTGLDRSITTRAKVASEQNFQQPVVRLAALSAIALVVLAWVLRQRRRRKLELWHSRFQDTE